MNKPQIVWLRRDLRLADQPAFAAAADAGPVVPVYVLDDDRPGEHAPGGAARWWLHHSLESLGRDLGRHRSQMVLRRGDAVQVLVGLARELGAGAIHALRHYEPWWRAAEDELAEALEDLESGEDGAGCELCLHDGNYLLPPGTVTTGGGDPYKIFTPFKDSMVEAIDGFAIGGEPSLSGPDSWPDGDALAEWDLLPTTPDWAGGLRDYWQVGSRAALDRFDAFLDRVADYDEARNLPSRDGTSRMSPHLHWGEVGPRQLWDRMSRHTGDGARIFRSELIWRDYAQNVIMQFPDYPRESYRDRYDTGLWRNPDRGHVIQEELERWQMGRTGYPIVDAGMRQLWRTGWMHNRVRMIAASFLIKHLLIDWRHGEKWYWDTLVDADYGSNGTNWQWVAGTGVDSNMFVRIMAPLKQSGKFDAAGYIREYVPELADLSDEDIHDPPGDKRPGGYPAKIIEHKDGRERALAAYHEMKGD